MGSAVPQRAYYNPAHLGQRRTLQQALQTLGLPAAEYYAFDPGTSKRFRGYQRQGGIWERLSTDALSALYRQAERAFHLRLRQVGHDHIENHEAAVMLIAAWRHVQNLMHRHGVEVQ